MPTFPDPYASKQTTPATDAELGFQHDRAREGGEVRPSAASYKDEHAVDACSGRQIDHRLVSDLPATWSESPPVLGDKSASIECGRNQTGSQQLQGISVDPDFGCPVVRFKDDPAEKEPVANVLKPVLLFPSWTLLSPSEEASAGKTTERRKRRVAPSLLPTQSVSAQIRRKKPANIVVRPVAWRRLGETEKFLLAAERCQGDGGIAVTLNLSTSREHNYMSRSRRTQARRLFQNQLNKALKEAGLSGLEYTFLFEISPEGRLHLHGVLRGAGLDETALKTLKLALRQAAGKIHGRAAARQVKLKRLYDAAGWARYIFNVRKSTANKLGTNRLMVMSESMGRLLRVFHEETRETRRVA